VDVVIVSLRPRSRARLGLDYEHVASVNPRIVYCSVSGFGETEAARDRAVFDTSALARSGLLSLITGEFDQPMRIQALLSDMLAGTYASYGVMGALMARARTGRGQEVKTSLLASSIAFADSAFLHAFVAQRLGQTRGRLKYRTAGFLFVAGDGLPLAVHVAPSPVKNWGNFAEAMERPDLQRDPRFATKRGREENYPDLHALMSAQAKLKPRDYWLERLEGRDVPASPIHALADVFAAS
jgi:formyl-CoA transferase